MKIIIMGCGRVGAKLAEMFAAENHKVTVVDSSQQAFTRLPKNYPGTKLVGNGLDEDVLRRAGIEEADCFVAVTNGDNRNIMAAQIAKHTFHVRRVLCRIYDPLRQEVYTNLGLDSICPTTIGATLLHDAVLQPEQSTVSAALSIAEGHSVPIRGLPASGAVNGTHPGEQSSAASRGGVGGRSGVEPTSEASWQNRRR